MVLREQDKHFLWSLFVAMGIIFVWKGLWEGLYEIPYIGDPWVALFLGLSMLTFSGLIFKEFDPLGNVDKSVQKMLRIVAADPKRHEFKLRYHDEHLKKDMEFNASEIQGIEKNSIILKRGTKQSSQEFFVPGHRVTEIIHNGRVFWKL